MKKLFAMLLALVMVMSLVACGGNNAGGNTTTETPSTSETPSTPTTPETPVVEEYTGPKDYRGWTTSRATFNPHMYTNSKIMMNYGTLVAAMSVNDELAWIPHHASEMPVTNDGGITWNIKIRDGLTFSTGTTLDATDYEYSMKMLLDPKLVNKNATYLFDPVVILNAKDYFEGNCTWEEVGIKALSANELQIVLKYPATEIDFLSTICSLIWPVEEETYEACMNADRTSTTYGTTVESVVSCGMFTLTEWVTDGYETYVRNDNDPLVQEGYVFLDSYNARYISQNSTRAEMFWAGELDNHSLTGDDYVQYKNDPRAHSLLSPNVWGFFMNGASKNPIMQSQDFRNAVHYGTPRERICEDVYKLYPAAPAIVSTGIYTGDTYYRETERAKEIAAKYASNETLALELFEKAYAEYSSEYADGKVSVEYIYFEGQEDQKRQAEILQESLENLFGKERFELTLRAMPPASAYDAYRAGDYDLGLGVRLANAFNPWATMNVWTTGYADPYQTGFASDEFDQLQYNSMYGDIATDDAAKVEALARMEEMLLEYGAFCPVMQNDNCVMYHERIELASDVYLPLIGFNTNQINITAAP